MTALTSAVSRRLVFVLSLSVAAWASDGRCNLASAEQPLTATVAKDSAEKPKEEQKEPEAKQETAKSEAAPAEQKKAEEAAPKKDAKVTAVEPAAESKNGAAAKTPTATAIIKPAEKPAEPKRRKVRLAQFVLKDSMPEATERSGLFGELHLDLAETISRIDRAANDTSITGAILDIRNPEIGRGKVYELREAIQRFRAKGKKIYAQIESAMPSDYLVASACDEIVMPESGVVMLPGIHAEATFYKNLLGKLGVRADFIHMGAYKGAAEPLTREEFSGPVRENLTSLIDSLYDDMVTTIVKDRPLSVAQAKEIIDTGLLTATQAKKAGLIDRIAYPDTLRDELATSYDAAPLVYVKNYGQKKVDTDFSGPMGFLKLMQAMMGGGSSAKRDSGKKIAVVYAVGPIMTGKSRSDPFGSETMGSTSRTSRVEIW